MGIPIHCRYYYQIMMFFSEVHNYPPGDGRGANNHRKTTLLRYTLHVYGHHAPSKTALLGQIILMIEGNFYYENELCHDFSNDTSPK